MGFTLQIFMLIELNGLYLSMTKARLDQLYFLKLYHVQIVYFLFAFSAKYVSFSFKLNKLDITKKFFEYSFLSTREFYGIELGTLIPLRLDELDPLSLWL